MRVSHRERIDQTIVAGFEAPKRATRNEVGRIVSEACAAIGSYDFTDRPLGNSTGYLVSRMQASRTGRVDTFDLQLQPPPRHNSDNFLYRQTRFIATSKGDTRGGYVSPNEPPYDGSPEWTLLTKYAAKALGDIAVAYTIARSAAECAEDIDIAIGNLPELTAFWKGIYAPALITQDPGTMPMFRTVAPDYRLPLDDLLPAVAPAFSDMISSQRPAVQTS